MTNNQNPYLVFDRMIGIYVRVFRLIAIFPLEGRDYSFIGTRLLTFYLICSSIIHWSMVTVYCFTASSLEAADICVMVAVLGLDWRYNMMLYKRKTFLSLFNGCRALWRFCNEEGQRTVMIYEHKIRLVGSLFFLSCFAINVAGPLGAIFTRLPPLEPNGTERRILAYNWYAENTAESGLGYWPNFWIQVIVTQAAVVYVVSCDSAMPLLAMISSGYFRHLRNRLLFFHKYPGQKERELVRNIIFQQKLFMFCEKLKTFFETMLVTQLLSTGYNISLVLIKLSSEPSAPMYISLFCTSVCQLYLIQWAPDYLYDESENVAVAAYSAYIHTLGNGYLSKNLFFMMTRSQQPVQIKILRGLVSLSLETFAKMMKSAFSVFTLLRNVDW